MEMVVEPDIWRRRAICFFASQCITLFGSQIVQFAIVWYVTLQTSSGIWVAAFAVCSYLPQFLVSFLGGVWADRHYRKRLIIGADALIAGVTLIMLLIMPLITTESALLAALLFMSTIRSVGAGIQSPAVNAVIPQLVPEEHLMRYNGINATMQSVVQFAAPAVAAVVLTTSTLRATLLIDVLTAIIGIGVLSCIRLRKQQASESTPSLLADMGIGVRYARSCMPVRNALIVYALFIFLAVPAGFLAGLFVSRVYGDTYWYLTAVELVGFAGMAAGGLLMGAWGGFSERRLTLASGLALFGVTAIAMGVSRSFVLYLAFMAVYGVALTAVQTVITTILQEESEESTIGRVFGLMGSLYSSCYPIGMVIFGAMADSVPLQWIMVASGVALMATASAAYYSQRGKTGV
ncbi:MAG: MFS transporter [Eggerthellaceae bacterium]|nr:MFS transporter [Eggerthellaceae bacterium]